MTDKEFWDWFKSKKTEIEEFIIAETDDYSIYDELTDKLNSYNSLSRPEIGLHFIKCKQDEKIR
jgi:hypothetical protein